MDGCSQSFENVTDVLIGGESRRVWSLIVTIFGDLARGEGEGISGAVLTRLVGMMGVKPAAMRVALHRLRKDGWIDSMRTGRGSQHVLTPFGRSQSAGASPRIYDRTRQFPALWHLLICGADDVAGRERLDQALLDPGYLPIGAQVAMAPGALPEDSGGLMAVETCRWSVPVWLRDQICPPDLLAQGQALHADFTAIRQILDQPAHLTVLEATVVRLLIVHSWRRLLFRHPDLPAEFFPDTWPGEVCRAMFCDLLQRLPVVSVAEIETLLSNE